MISEELSVSFDRFLEFDERGEEDIMKAVADRRHIKTRFRTGPKNKFLRQAMVTLENIAANGWLIVNSSEIHFFMIRGF